MPYLGRPVTNAGQFEIIDDISSGFNGSETSFTLQVGGTDIQPDSANVTIVLDGVVQIPPTSYSITGSTLNFSEAPANGTGFHGVLAGQSQFIESGFITNTHISDSANISGSKINTDFSAQTVQAKIFSGMISSSAQISTDISGSLGSNAAIIRTLDRTTLSGSVTTVSSSLASRVTVNEGRVNQGLNTTDSPTFAGATITGTLTAQEVHTEFESASILFTSGSTKFGDSGDDIHNMTGSIRVSGSLANESFINGHNVGIGTENPITTLDIHSDELGMVLRTGDSGRIGMALMNSGTGTATNFTDGLLIKLDSDESGYVGLAADNPSKVFHLGANNTNVITISGSSQVGIGTTSPDGKLHVRGSEPTIKVQEDGSNHYVELEGGGSTAFINFYDSLRFREGTTERIRIDGSGNVGIGTTTMDAHVNINSGETNAGLHVESTDSNANISMADNAGSVVIAAAGNEFIVETGGSASTAGSGASERFRIDSSGNVGIGSSSPTAKLDVNGGATINGNTIVGRGGSQKGKLTIQSRTGTATRKTNAIVAVPYNDTSESICMIGMDGQSSNNEMHIGSNTSDFMSPTYIDFFTAANVNSQTNSRAMRITSEQKVSIGTDTPLATFHVEHTTDDTDENGNIAMTVGGGASGNVRHYWGINNSGNYAYYGAVEHATQYVPLVLQPNGSKVGIGDASPEGKLTVKSAAGDNTAVLSLKSGDVSHPFTSYHEADTYFAIQKYSNSEGGANLRGYSEGERGLNFSHFGTSFDSPANGRGADKGMQFFTYDSSGTSIGPVNSGGTCYIFRAYRSAGTHTIFMVDEDGDLHADGSTSITGFDYAEMFEWEDGNPSSEDRVGYSVVFGSSGDKIRVASGSEEPIGVVSARPGVIGDNPMGWHGTWKTDEWDRKIPGLIPMVSWSYDFTSDNGEVIQKTYKIEIAQTGSFLSNIPSGSSERGVPYSGSIPSNANYYNKEVSQVSDEYDDTMDYTTRRSRKEWDTIGLMGKIKIRTGQATGSRWIKMKDVSDSIQLWLVK